MIEKLGTLILIVLLSFAAGWWSAWNTPIFFRWLGGVGVYWSSVVDHDCRVPQGYVCSTSTPLDKTTSSPAQ